MSLSDDTFDCCGRYFDSMGDPLLHRVPGTEYDVYCDPCWSRSTWGRREALDKLVQITHELGLYEDCDECVETGGHQT